MLIKLSSLCLVSYIYTEFVYCAVITFILKTGKVQYTHLFWNRIHLHNVVYTEDGRKLNPLLAF